MRAIGRAAGKSMALAIAVALVGCVAPPHVRDAPPEPRPTSPVRTSALPSLCIPEYVEDLEDEIDGMPAGWRNSIGNFMQGFDAHSLGADVVERRFEDGRREVSYEQQGRQVGLKTVYDRYGRLRKLGSNDANGGKIGIMTLFDPDRGLRVDGCYRQDGNGSQRCGLWSVTDIETGAKRVQWF